MIYTRNAKKMTQVVYVRNVMMIIDLNVNLWSLNFHPSSAPHRSAPQIGHALWCVGDLVRNVKKVTQVAYVQNVMMVINLNVDLWSWNFHLSSAQHGSAPQIGHALWRVGDLHEEREDIDPSGLPTERDDDN